MSPGQQYHVFVFKKANAFESIAALGQSSQGKFDRSAIELIKNMLHAHGADIQYDRRCQPRDPPRESRDYGTSGMVVGHKDEAASRLRCVELIVLKRDSQF